MELAMGKLSREVREISFGTTCNVERIHGPLSPIQFLREFVMPGKPCIITGAIEHWGALKKWSNEYLCEVLRDEIVSVHFTPDGRADCVVNPEEMASVYNCSLEGPTNSSELLFVSACVEKMPFPQALDAIINSTPSGIAYAQQQNDCFKEEYHRLWADAELHIPWATEALGLKPEAVNLWIGNERSTTSFHKDHYENLYAVVAGEKHFTLLPPMDVHRLYVRNYPCATYTRGKESMKIRVEDPVQMVPWVSVDPNPKRMKEKQVRQEFPKYFEGEEAFKCSVRAGEILYLPSMWYHHVRQQPDPEGRAIAINFWYDMQYDSRFAYFNFLQSLCC